MKVSGIFKTLIVVVACIIIGAVVLNVFLPNVVNQLSNAIENSIHQATGLKFDFNGDGTIGSNSQDASGTKPGGNTTAQGGANNNAVQGFTSGKSGGSSGGSGI